MAKIYYEADADLGRLRGRTIAIMGYGSQGHAHALNLRDSGLDVIVGLYEGSRSWEAAEREGLRVMTPDRAAAQADIIMLLVPDDRQRDLFQAAVRPHLKPGKTLMFAHGFNIQYGQVQPPPEIDVSMVAPKSPGHIMRDMYVDGVGVPALVAVHQNPSGTALPDALAYAKGIGCTRAGVIETTFQEEVETDLFGEQTVLCGGISALMKAGFETLVEAGYQPEVAYFECMNEMKLIVDLIFQGGLARMRYSVSDTAEFGDYISGPRVIDDHVRQSMRQILAEIRSGEFARTWILENQAGRPVFNALRAREREHQIERIGAELRSMMSWTRRT